MPDKQMVTVVYTLGRGSHYKNAELRYSLRSIENNLINVKNVVIIGIDPGLKEVDVIEASDPSPIPDNNIFAKLLLACKSDLVTDKFLFMNDDHFILDMFDAAEFPYLHSGTLKNYLNISRTRGGYWDRVRRVMSKFPDGNYYDVHTPILYEKEKFLKLEEIYSQYGMVIKSLYGNQYSVGGKQIRDCKTTVPPLSADVSFVSTYPKVKAAMFRFISERFPDASRYE